MNGKWGIERAKREEAGVRCTFLMTPLFQPLVSGAAVIWLWNQGAC